MRRSCRLVSFTLGVLFICGARTGFAQVPAAPINCPGAGLVNVVVCATDALRQQAFELERQYFAAAAADYFEASSIRFDWQTHSQGCAPLISQDQQIRTCIAESFEKFGKRLSAVATPAEAKSREQLFQDAYVILTTLTDFARQDRLACIQSEALAVDDGLSSARDIAVVAAKRCRKASVNLVRFLAAEVDLRNPFMTQKRISPDEFSALADILSEPDHLIETVLKLRAAKRKPAPQPAQKARPPKTL